MQTATIAAPSGVAATRSNFLVDVFRRLIDPAAKTAAGMIGADEVATRLLAGAWFGLHLLWIALFIVPMVIVTLDSASRVGILSNGRGMIDMVRTEIGAWLAWLIVVPIALVRGRSAPRSATRATRRSPCGPCRSCRGRWTECRHGTRNRA